VGICVCVCIYICICMYVHVCICVGRCVCVLCMHIDTWIHHGPLSSSGRDQYDNSCITHHIGPFWWKLRQPNKHHQFAMRIFSPHLYAAFLIQFPCPNCMCMLHAQPQVTCVGSYNVVYWWFNSFTCGEWNLGMLAAEYKSNFLSYWVHLYTDV